MNVETINLFVALFVVTWLVLGLVVFILQRKPSVAQLDTEASARLAELQHTREVMSIYEQAYTNATAIQRTGVDTVLSILKVLAPLTPLKSDDAVVGVLEDIQTPGEPAPAPLPPVTVDPEAQG